jgi:hypothetical protein
MIVTVVMVVMMLLHMAAGFKTWESPFRETYCLHLLSTFSWNSMIVHDVGEWLPDFTVTLPKDINLHSHRNENPRPHIRVSSNLLYISEMLV